MTVTIPEINMPADIAGGVTSSFALSTTLVSSDLVVLLMSKPASGTVSTVTIGGVAPTAFNNWQNGSGGGRLYVYTHTGLTGSVSVGYNTNTSVNTRFTAFVVRGLTNSSITNSSISTWSSTLTAGNTDEGPTSVAADAGQAAIFAAVVSAGTVTFPSNTTPSGWTTDRAGSAVAGSHAVAHLIPSSAVSVQANVQTSTATTMGSVMLLVGDAASVPSLTSTFVGWGNPIF